MNPETELSDLQRHLDLILRYPESYRGMGVMGRRNLERRHTPESYAQAIVKLAAEAGQFRASAVALGMIRRLAAPLAPLGAAATDAPLLRRVGSELQFLCTPQSQAEPR